MRPAYLTGERIFLRPMLEADANQATAWFPGIFPINAARAETWLKDQHQIAWGNAPTLHLAVVRLDAERQDDVRDDDPAEILGRVAMEHPRGRTSTVTFKAAPHLSLPEADELRADVLRVLIPWARDELELMTVTVTIPAEDVQSIAAAEALDMALGVRLREHISRPGRRVDSLLYQALNPNWHAPALNSDSPVRVQAEDDA